MIRARSTTGSHDLVFERMQREAEDLIRSEPAMAGFVSATILAHKTLESAVIHRISARLAHSDVQADLIRRAFLNLLAKDDDLSNALQADLLAVFDRDPACLRVIEPILYFKGFHALQTHRLAHAQWKAGRYDSALYLQSRSSAIFQTDVHPAAHIGSGILLDHATGFVVGSTAVIEDEVSVLHHVTVGGTGKETGDRHPKIRRGALLGAGATILGNIEIGAHARIAAGSLVLHPVPGNTTAAGVPARIVAQHGYSDAPRTMAELMNAKPLVIGKRREIASLRLERA